MTDHTHPDPIRVPDGSIPHGATGWRLSGETSVRLSVGSVDVAEVNQPGAIDQAKRERDAARAILRDLYAAWADPSCLYIPGEFLCRIEAELGAEVCEALQGSPSPETKP